MSNNDISFGEFITAKREKKEITLREMARRLDITPSYYSDIEKNRRNPPEKSKLDEIAAILNLSDEDRNFMYDLAGKMRNAVPPDLPNYIVGRDYVVNALRRAQDMGAGETEWLEMIKVLEKRKE
jgi:transcriptional regulator with XRE-family HTH domain